MKRVIVTTTIHAPTEAIRRFDAMEGYTLVVAGDRKTPAGYRLDRGIYLSPEDQVARDPELSEAIGWDCIQRRNFALLEAFRMGADVVALVDDDNVPHSGWGEDLCLGRPTSVRYFESQHPAFDPLGATDHPHLWHRGFPLPWVGARDYSRESRATVVPDVQADLWNGDPDVDAICRMIHRPDVRFDPERLPVASASLTPFNSQNTFLRGALLRDYFLCPAIGRMDNIWAGYHLQALGHVVVHHRPSVDHARNPHDLLRDLDLEAPYVRPTVELVTALARDPDAYERFLPERARRARALYQRHF